MYKGSSGGKYYAVEYRLCKTDAVSGTELEPMLSPFGIITNKWKRLEIRRGQIQGVDEEHGPLIRAARFTIPEEAARMGLMTYPLAEAWRWLLLHSLSDWTGENFETRIVRVNFSSSYEIKDDCTMATQRGQRWCWVEPDNADSETAKEDK